MTAPKHKIDVTRISGGGASSFREGEDRSLRCDNHRRNSIGVVIPLTCDEDVSQLQRRRHVLLRDRHSRDRENEC